jgi:hypothetical protein
MTKIEDSTGIPKIVRNVLNGVVRFDAFNHLYTEPRLALWELQQRRKDVALKNQARQFLGASAEEVLKKFSRPRALLFRNIATPTHETIRFLKLAKQMGLKPLILEYLDDKFVSSENRSKRLLGKMPVYEHTASNGQDIIEYETVCDFNEANGKRLADVVCLNDEGLVSLHHRLFRTLTGLNPKTCTADVSDWLKSTGGRPEQYYEQALTLLIRDGILFENFMPFRSESAFAKSIIVPAFEKLKNVYAVKPLIVRLLPEEVEMRKIWDSYPRKVKKYIWM